MAFVCRTSYAQDSLAETGRIIELPSSFLTSINKKVSRLESKVFSTSEKALRKLESQEERLKRKLLKKELFGAAHVFGNLPEWYRKLRAGISQPIVFRSGYSVQIGQSLLVFENIVIIHPAI
jgi:hypothetical protein